MSKATGGHIVFKPTFMAVESMQQQLRRHLESLIAENRPLHDEAEKTLFYRELSHSTLGLGICRDFRIYLGNKIYRHGNIESSARWIASLTSSDAVIPGDMGNPASIKVSISVFWKKLLDELFFIFPMALDKSISMSREGESSTARLDSFNVGGK